MTNDEIIASGDIIRIIRSKGVARVTVFGNANAKGCGYEVVNKAKIYFTYHTHTHEISNLGHDDYLSTVDRRGIIRSNRRNELVMTPSGHRARVCEAVIKPPYTKVECNNYGCSAGCRVQYIKNYKYRCSCGG